MLGAASSPQTVSANGSSAQLLKERSSLICSAIVSSTHATAGFGDLYIAEASMSSRGATGLLCAAKARSLPIFLWYLILGCDHIGSPPLGRSEGNFCTGPFDALPASRETPFIPLSVEGLGMPVAESDRDEKQRFRFLPVIRSVLSVSPQLRARDDRAVSIAPKSCKAIAEN